MKPRKSLFAVSVIVGLLGTTSTITIAQEPTAAPALRQPEGVQIDRYERAAEILQQMLPSDIADSMASETPPETPFAAELSRLAFENAFVQLWTRPGLGLRERSLVTMGILIAQGSAGELEYHIAAGLRNGLTPEEIEEVIYHSTAYAGFPRASQASAVATKVIAQEREAGNIESAPER